MERCQSEGAAAVDGQAGFGVRCLAQEHLGSAQVVNWHSSIYRATTILWSVLEFQCNEMQFST